MSRGGGGAMLAVDELTVSLARRTGVRARREHRSTILDRVSLRVDPGECLAVVGASGAGKSVLARTLLGLTGGERGWHVTARELRIGARDLRGATERDWRATRGASAALVLQDALQSLDPLRSIGAEVSEVLAVHGVPRAERRARAVAALEAAGLPDAALRLGQRSTELSGGMRQRALIAAALAGSPDLLIADEPTTALDSTTAARVLQLFGEIRDRGTGLVFISHDLSNVARIADRIAVMEHGRIVEAGPAREVLEHPVHPATLALVAAAPSGPKPGAGALPGNELIRVRGVTRSYGGRVGAATGFSGVAGLDLDVRKGEAIGVVGASGAGKTTLARILVGAERPDVGEVERPDDRTRVRLIPQDPLATFDPRWRVRRIVEASTRPDTAGRRRAPEELLAEVGLDAALLDRFPATLSGGQRQRVAIARARAARPHVLVCDEPVSALDVVTQAGILTLLRDLQERERLALVFISHDLAATRSVSDRIVVMHRGEIVESGPTERVLAHPTHPFTRELVAAAQR